MADSAKKKIDTRIQLLELIDGHDGANSATVPHSRLDARGTQGGTISTALAAVNGFSIVTGLITTTGFVVITLCDTTTGHTKEFIYDGLGANTDTDVDFFFARIDEQLGNAVPNAAFKFANQTNFLPQLSGVGDTMIIPMSPYNMNTGSYDIQVISASTSSICKITCVLANRV